MEGHWLVTGASTVSLIAVSLVRVHLLKVSGKEGRRLLRVHERSRKRHKIDKLEVPVILWHIV